jgi:hypothetical protein
MDICGQKQNKISRAKLQQFNFSQKPLTSRRITTISLKNTSTTPTVMRNLPTIITHNNELVDEK